MHHKHFISITTNVFPVVYYYKKNSKLKHKSIVFLSDRSTHHDITAVYTKNVDTTCETKSSREENHLFQRWCVTAF